MDITQPATLKQIHSYLGLEEGKTTKTNGKVTALYDQARALIKRNGTLAETRHALDNLKLVYGIKMKSFHEERFGALATHLAKCRAALTPINYETAMDRILEALKARTEELAGTEGVFRIGGSHSHIPILVDYALIGDAIDDSVEIHDLIGALKRTLREAPPLIDDDGLTRLNADEGRATLAALEEPRQGRLSAIHGLARAAINRAPSKMDAGAIATAIGPSLCSESQVIAAGPSLLWFFDNDCFVASAKPAPPPKEDKPAPPPPPAEPAPELTVGSGISSIAGGIAVAVALAALVRIGLLARRRARLV